MKRLSLEDMGTLSFYPPDLDKFPSLRLAYDALASGDSAVIALNTANEVASEAFFSGKIGFTDIPRIVGKTLERHRQKPRCGKHAGIVVYTQPGEGRRRIPSEKKHHEVNHDRFIYAVIALSVLIVVHEFGHFITARLVNVKVITFSLGFGKKLLSRKKGETEYAISAMPLGGYVKLLGESPDEEVPEEEKERSFTNKTPFQRFLIVFAGPFFNLVFALLIIYLSLIINGYGTLPAKIDKVLDVFRHRPQACRTATGFLRLMA